MINKVVLIAIDEYNDPVLDNLHNCKNDINEILGILSSKYDFDDFEVFAQKEQTTYKFIFNSLYDLFINSLENENILLIYAGHGEFNQILNSSYWLPSDAQHDNQTTWFNLNDLISFINASKAFHISIISDSCFSGAIFNPKQRGGGMDALEWKKSRLALTSGSIEKVSDGIKGELSPFTKSLFEVLNENTEIELPFSILSFKVILKFDTIKKQTPMAGSLINSGHEGGSFIFKLKTPKLPYKEITLPLNMDLPVDFNYECIIPLFLENISFDHNFVNSFVQQLAFKLISDTRAFFHSEEEYIIEISKEIPFRESISYKIHILNHKFLSLSILSYAIMGGIWPQISKGTLNFAFKPDRKLYLSDFIDYFKYQTTNNFLAKMIESFAEDIEHKNILMDTLDKINIDKLEFTFDTENLTIDFSNELIFAFKGAGNLVIPFIDLKEI